MLNVCPKRKSCGTYSPIWTDAVVPDTVGEVFTIDVYRVGVDDCKWLTLKVQVMRCTSDTDYDVIYRYVGRYIDYCATAFCGMN